MADKLESKLDEDCPLPMSHSEVKEKAMDMVEKPSFGLAALKKSKIGTELAAPSEPVEEMNARGKNGEDCSPMMSYNEVKKEAMDMVQEPPCFGSVVLRKSIIGTDVPAPIDPVQEINTEGKHDEVCFPMISHNEVEKETRDMVEEPPSFGPSALRQSEIGTEVPAPTDPVQEINAKGITKKNRLNFHDDFVNNSSSQQPRKKIPKLVSRSPHKQARVRKQSSPTKIQKNDDILENKIGTPSEGPLDDTAPLGTQQQPKAYQWACYEYFYSNIDQVLFQDGFNDFVFCLKMHFPQVTSSEMTRAQWTNIRRMLGKPRRYSPTLFALERQELIRRRTLIRHLQKMNSINIEIGDLPDEIPMQLVVGTRVTALLWKPINGLFTGVISAIDESTHHTYQIIFDESDIGTHSVPDYEVLSNEPPDTILLYYTSVPNSSPVFGCRQDINDPNNCSNENMTSFSDINKHIDCDVSVSLLNTAFDLSKEILDEKTTKMNCMNEYDTVTEMRQPFALEMSDDSNKEYATVVCDSETLHIEIEHYLNNRKQKSPWHIREECHLKAALLFEKHNNGAIKDPKTKEIITDLTALLFQIESLSKRNRSDGMTVLQGSMDQIKNKLAPHHRKLFETHVEVHMRKIQLGFEQISMNSTSSSNENDPNSSVSGASISKL